MAAFTGKFGLLKCEGRSYQRFAEDPNDTVSLGVVHDVSNGRVAVICTPLKIS